MDTAIEPDFTLGAFLFAAAAITGSEITIQPCKYAQSKQADVIFISILEKMDCKIRGTHQKFTLSGPYHLEGLDVTLEKFSVIFLILCAIAPFAKSPIRITHIGPLKKQERSLSSHGICSRRFKNSWHRSE
jgi:3-phosphoshikimate 1-carboxyvinyltransferase